MEIRVLSVTHFDRYTMRPGGHIVLPSLRTVLPALCSWRGSITIELHPHKNYVGKEVLEVYYQLIVMLFEELE